MLRTLHLVRKTPRKPRTPVKQQVDYLVTVALRGKRGTSQGWSWPA